MEYLAESLAQGIPSCCGAHEWNRHAAGAVFPADAVGFVENVADLNHWCVNQDLP
jgi:hypothetical protein